MTDLVVVGLDGAGFHLLDRWLEDDTLPTLNRFAELGATATLRSTYPPVTCPSWRCYSTGVNPGKHGVFWWETVEREEGTFSIPTSTDFAAPDLWDFLGENGYRSAIINMPTTFPPRELEGWMISGGGGVDGNAYTYPRDLQAELEERFDYRVFIPGTSSNIGDDPDRVEQVLELIDMRFDVAEYLRDRYDPAFINLTVFYTNVFHHFFWDDDITRRVWQRVDARLGEFIDEENVLVISDHGSNPIDHVFNVNTWLEREGYLETTETVSDRLFRLGLTRDRITKVVDRLGVKNPLKRLMPRSVVSLFPSDDGTVSGRGKAEKIDWEASTAMASGQGPVYVLADSDRERAHLRAELAEKLATVRTPDGAPVAREVVRGADAYEGPFVADGPDLVIDQADNVHISGAVGSDGVFETPTGWVAENHRDGVLFAHGPDVADTSGLATRPHIYDIAPTILHWFGLPVPEHMDGSVLEELFDTDSEPGRRPVEFVDFEWSAAGDGHGSANQEQMRGRLRDLGYLSE